MKKRIIGWVTALVLLGITGGVWLSLDHRKYEEKIEENVSEGSFSGILVDAITHKRIPYGKLLVRGNQKNYHFQADEQGKFKLLLPTGIYHILPETMGYQKIGKNDEGRAIAIQDETHFINAKLEWWPAATIKGRVIDGSRTLLANISLEYVKDNSNAENFVFDSLTTNAKGIFEINDGYGGFCNIQITSDGYAPVTFYNVAMTPGKILDLGDIPMFMGTALFGEVRDKKTGKIISNAKLEILDLNGKIIRESYSASNGKFKLPAVELKDVKIRVIAQNFKTLEQNLVIRGNPEQQVTFLLEKTNGLTLIIQNNTGRGDSTLLTVTDVVLNKVVYEQNVSNGEFNLDGLAKGPYDVRALSDDGLTKAQIRLVAGGKARLILKPWATLSAKILDNDGSIAQNALYHYLKRNENGEWEEQDAWATIKEGAFELKDLDAGIYKIEIKHKNSNDITQSGDINLSLGDNEHIVLQFRSGGSITGKVTTQDGNPIPNAKLKILQDGRVENSDKNGNFRFNNVISENLTIEISSANYEKKSFSNINVPQGKEIQRDFQLSNEQMNPKNEEITKTTHSNEPTNAPDDFEDATDSLEDSRLDYYRNEDYYTDEAATTHPKQHQINENSADKQNIPPTPHDSRLNMPPRNSWRREGNAHPRKRGNRQRVSNKMPSED